MKHQNTYLVAIYESYISKKSFPPKFLTSKTLPLGK